MAKIQIKSEKLTSFGGIFPIMEKFDIMLSRTIDSTLGLHSKVYGYQYSEIIRSLACATLSLSQSTIIHSNISYKNQSHRGIYSYNILAAARFMAGEEREDS